MDIKRAEELIGKTFKLIYDPKYRIHWLALRGFYNHLSDEQFIRKAFKTHLGYTLNLSCPKTFNEKLQWLKLHDRKPIYITMVDKYTVKDYVASIIGSQYIIPTLGVWDHFEDIDFDALPDQFVLKCTHDSGGSIIVKDKSKLDIKTARKQINKSLKKNYYYFGREWPYKNVKPRIIAEKLMGSDDLSIDSLSDYKLQCFDGKFDNVMVCEGRFSQRGVRYHYFDRNWNYIPYCPYDDLDLSVLPKLKPSCFDEMVRIAEKLANGLHEVRVDLYEVNKQVYFGELTLYSQSGFDTDITREADIVLGNKLIIRDIQ